MLLFRICSLQYFILNKEFKKWNGFVSGVNIQPDPVKFVKINKDYWFNHEAENYRHPPEGRNGTSWTYAEWIFTYNPGVFGLVNGIACPTGVGLILVLTFMVVTSLPCVRMKGYFQVTHTSSTKRTRSFS